MLASHSSKVAIHQGFDPELWLLSVWSFIPSPCVYMGFLLVLLFLLISTKILVSEMAKKLLV